MEENYKEKYLQLYSDFENFKRNKEKEIEHIKEVSRKDTILKLIPLFDSIAEGKQYDINAMVLYKKLLVIFKNLDIELIDEKGVPFDSDIYEAVGLSKNGNVESNMISQIVTNGYKLNGEIIKHPKVIVEK